MIVLTREREAVGWTRFRLGSEARIHPARVGQFENLKAQPYPPELQRLADALRFRGEPAALLEKVDYP